MYQQLKEMRTSQSVTDVFSGIDRNLRIADGFMSDMQNLTSDNYPMLSTRAPRVKVDILVEANGLIAKEKLAWISKRNFVYGGEDLTDRLSDMGIVLEDSRKTLVSMGAYLIILPDKVYINTADFDDCGKIEAVWSNDTPATITMCMADGTAYGEYTSGKEAPADPQAGQYWLDTSGETNVLMVFSNDCWVAVETVYSRISCTGIGKQFREGDGVTISGCMEDVLNGSKILKKVSDNEIVIIGMVPNSITQEAGTLHLERRMPDMDYVTECSNRIWGCRYGTVDGKTVNEIYCCKLGNFRNWNCFEGLATDSYRASVGTDGPWTGAATHMGYPLFFKENCMHKVFVSATGAHEIADTACRGVQPGCGGSLVVVDENLYYLATSGVCVYDGSLPVCISNNLGRSRGYDAVAGTIDGKYYLSVRRDSGWELLVYDTRQGIWVKEDNTQAVYMARLGDELYLLDPAGDLWGMTGRAEGEKEKTVPWSMTTGVIGYTDAKQKYVSRFVLRMKLQDGASAQVLIRYNSGDWLPCGSINGNGLRSTVLPIRPRRCDHFQIRISGRGEMQLYSIGKVYERGSDVCGY